MENIDFGSEDWSALVQHYEIRRKTFSKHLYVMLLEFLFLALKELRLL